MERKIKTVGDLLGMLVALPADNEVHAFYWCPFKGETYAYIHRRIVIWTIGGLMELFQDRRAEEKIQFFYLAYGPQKTVLRDGLQRYKKSGAEWVPA